MTFVLKQSVKQCLGESQSIVLQDAIDRLTRSSAVDRWDFVFPIQQVLCDLVEDKVPELDEP